MLQDRCVLMTYEQRVKLPSTYLKVLLALVDIYIYFENITIIVIRRAI